METSKKGRSQIFQLNFIISYYMLLFISYENANAQACSGTISYVRNLTLISSGATPYPSAYTGADCQAACTADNACLSYQLDLNPGTPSLCWLQKTTLSVARPAPNIDEQIKLCQTAPGCVPIYVINAITVSIGAVSSLAITHEACKAACNADSTCLSYQLDTNPGTPSFCWLQKSTLSLSRPATNIIEYVKYQNCGETSTTTTTKALSSGNTCGIYVANSILISSGAIANPALTQALCEAACTADSTCLSYQIDSNPGAQSFCWLQRSTLIVARPAPNIIEYIKGPNCGCVLKYAVNATSVSNGAVANPVANQAACEAACTNDSTCLSYQLDTSIGTTSFCWLQKTTLSSARPVANIVEYVKYQDCGSTTTSTTALSTGNTGCSILYRANSTLISSGATAYSALTNALCEAACTADSTCLSYQIDINPGATSFCWLQRTTLSVARPAPNIIELIKITNCGQECSTRYAMNTTTISIGAVAYPAMNQAACQFACDSDSTCLSYQLDTNIDFLSYCWLQKSTISSARPVPNMVEYIKYRTC